MGNHNDTESYSATGIYLPFGYAEIDNEGNKNVGLSFSISTPHVGPYAETGSYYEASWDKNNNYSTGHGVYSETGVFVGNELGGYTAVGVCSDTRDHKSNSQNSPPPPDIKTNKSSSNSSSSKKSIDEVAREVYKGNYGNGAERRKRLEEEGYNYKEVQDRVNKKYY